MNVLENVGTRELGYFLEWCGAADLGVGPSVLKTKVASAFEATLLQNRQDSARSGSHSDMMGRWEQLRWYVNLARRFGVITEEEQTNLLSRC